MNELTNWDAFVIFARMYPHEAYEQNPERFQQFMLKLGYNLSFPEIELFLEITMDKSVKNN